MNIIHSIIILVFTVVTPYLLLILMNAALSIIGYKASNNKTSPKLVFDYLDVHYFKMLGICIFLTAIFFLIDYTMILNKDQWIVTNKLILGFGCLTTALLLHKPTKITRQQKRRRLESKESVSQEKS